MSIDQITPQNVYGIAFLLLFAMSIVIGLIWAWLEDRETPTARRKARLRKSQLARFKRKIAAKLI